MKKRTVKKWFALLMAAVTAASLVVSCTPKKGKGQLEDQAVARGFDEEGDVHYFDDEAIALAGGAEETQTHQQAEATLDIVNQKRASAGLPPLDWSEDLSQAAMVRAQEAEKKFSHTRPNGQDWYTVNSAIMYGENLAQGYYDANSVVNAWMASPTHRANIETAAYSKVGVAAYQTSSGNWYWAQEFG